MTDRPAQMERFDMFVFLRGALWRPWMVTSATVAGTMIAVLIAMLMPPVYQSTARILIESQQIPDALARSTVTASAAERLAVIEQRLMTRQNLLDVSRRLELFRDRPELTPTERVEALRDATRIESILFNPTPRKRTAAKVSAFTISFETDDARQAAQVTNEFVSMVLEQNLAARTARASETHDFFKAEVERLALALNETEAEIAAFKTRNQAFLPEALKLRLVELNTLRKQQNNRAIRIARLAGEQATAAELGLLNLAEARVEDDQTVTPASLTGTASSLGARKQGQLDLLEAQQAATAARLAEVEIAIDRTNQVEMTLSAMGRRFEQLQVQHRDAVRKQNEAATGEKLEDTRQSERFEVIEQAHVPERPIAPRREFVAMGGALASLTLAVAFAGMLELLSKTVRSAADLNRMLNVRPILEMPNLPTRHERRLVAMRQGAIASAAIAVTSGLVAGLHLYVTPLDVMVRSWARQSGTADLISYLQQLI